MSNTKSDLMLHPVRFRIINLLNGRELTPQQIGAALKDVAHATLYRHINALVDGDVLEMVDERQVRGTMERVYTLKLNASVLTANDVANLSKQAHEDYFTTFIASVLGDFRRYLDMKETVKLEDDHVRYSKIALHLTDDEANTLAQNIVKLIGEAASNPPSPERKRYLLSLITVPDVEEEDH